MASPKDGSAGSIVAPQAPPEAVVADAADPGAMGPEWQRNRERAAESPPPGAPTPDPESEEAKKKVWIEFVLIDDDDNPVPGEPYKVKLPDGTSTTGTTNEKGLVRIEGIDPGSCQITFPRWDESSWHDASVKPPKSSIPPDPVTTPSNPPGSSAPSPPPSSGSPGSPGAGSPPPAGSPPSNSGNAPGSGSPPPTSETRDYATRAATLIADYKTRGVTYLMGGDASSGGTTSDCSHFVHDVITKEGSTAEFVSTQTIDDSADYESVSDGKAGDIIVQGGDDGKTGHMGIYKGTSDSQGRLEGWQMGVSGPALGKWGPNGWFHKDRPVRYFRPKK